MATISLSDILQLSVAERIQLAQDIWDSIAAQPDALPLSDEQRRELDRRLEDHRMNPESGIPWDQLRARLLGQE